jgi:hypothetical protein
MAEDLVKDYVLKAECFFYAGQPIPEYNPNRIKFGKSITPNQRQQHHKTASPKFTYLKAYPALHCWESEILGRLKKEAPNKNWKFLNKEVMECQDFNEVIGYLDNLFSQLPRLDLTPLIEGIACAKLQIVSMNTIINAIKGSSVALDECDVIRHAHEKSESVSDAFRIFNEQTGKSRATFYRRKQQTDFPDKLKFSHKPRKTTEEEERSLINFVRLATSKTKNEKDAISYFRNKTGRGPKTFMKLKAKIDADKVLML